MGCASVVVEIIDVIVWSCMIRNMYMWCLTHRGTMCVGVVHACPTSVADPGFPRGGGANSPGGAPTYDFAKFSQKLHEIERIWTPRGGARPKFYYVDPPLYIYFLPLFLR